MRDKIKIDSGRMSKPLNKAPKLFSASEGDTLGEIDLQWDPVTGANFYILQICIHSEKNLNWIQIDIITRSSYTITGLKSGKKYCFRISAANTSGRGPWSRVVKKNVP